MAALAVLTAVGAAVSAAGSIYQGVAAANQAAYNAEVADINRNTALQQGEIEARDLARAQRGEIGRGIAVLGASGVRSDTGSPLEVMRESIVQGSHNVALRRWGYQAEATDYENRATASRSQITPSLIGGFGEAGGTLLTSGRAFEEVFG